MSNKKSTRKEKTLTFVRVHEIYREVESLKSKKFTVDRHVAIYQDSKGTQYAKSFEVNVGVEPEIPITGTEVEIAEHKFTFNEDTALNIKSGYQYPTEKKPRKKAKAVEPIVVVVPKTPEPAQVPQGPDKDEIEFIQQHDQMLQEVIGNKKVTPLSKELLIEVIKQNMRSPSLWSVLHYLITEFMMAVKIEQGMKGKHNGTWYRVYKNTADIEPWYSFHDSESAMKPFISQIVQDILRVEQTV
jgi:hypothetical protein